MSERILGTSEKLEKCFGKLRGDRHGSYLCAAAQRIRERRHERHEHHERHELHDESYSRPREGGLPRSRFALKGGSVPKTENAKFEMLRMKL